MTTSLLPKLTGTTKTGKSLARILEVSLLTSPTLWSNPKIKLFRFFKIRTYKIKTLRMSYWSSKVSWKDSLLKRLHLSLPAFRMLKMLSRTSSMLSKTLKERMSRVFRKVFMSLLTVLRN